MKRVIPYNIINEKIDSYTTVQKFDVREVILHHMREYDENYIIKRDIPKSYIDKITYDKIIRPSQQVKDSDIFNNIVVLIRFNNKDAIRDVNTGRIRENQSYIIERHQKRDNCIFGFVYNKSDNKYFMLRYYYDTIIDKKIEYYLNEAITIRILDTFPYREIEYFDKYEEMIAAILYKNLATKSELMNKILFFNKFQRDKFFNIIDKL